MTKVQYLLTCYSGYDCYLFSENLEHTDTPEKCAEECERSSETIEQAEWNLFQVSDYALPMIEHQENPRNDGALNFRTRRNIRSLARKLQSIADNIRIRPSSALLSVERAILLNEGLNEDEMQVVRNMHLERAPTTVFRIADHVGNYVTPHTLHAALRYLSYSATSPLEELALSCELVKVIFHRIKNLSQPNSVTAIINEFINDRLDEVLH